MPLSDPAALEQPGLDRAALADNLIRAFLAQALDHGVFHADLHEGNLFVAAPAELTAVDFGIVGRLGPAERRYLAEILWGFLQPRLPARRRGALRGRLRARRPQPSTPSPRRCGRSASRSSAAPASEVSMGRLLTQLFEITALFDMRLRPELVLLQKTMVTVEGVARRIDPGHDIWAAAEPGGGALDPPRARPRRPRPRPARRGRPALHGLARLAEARRPGRRWWSAPPPPGRAGSRCRRSPSPAAAFVRGPPAREGRLGGPPAAAGEPPSAVPGQSGARKRSRPRACHRPRPASHGAPSEREEGWALAARQPADALPRAVRPWRLASRSFCAASRPCRRPA